MVVSLYGRGRFGVSAVLDRVSSSWIKWEMLAFTVDRGCDLKRSAELNKNLTCHYSNVSLIPRHPGKSEQHAPADSLWSIWKGNRFPDRMLTSS